MSPVKWKIDARHFHTLLVVSLNLQVLLICEGVDAWESCWNVNITLSSVNGFIELR